MVLSVVVHDLDLVDIPLAPLEADSPLVVDPYAVLTGTVALESFQPVAGGTRRSERLWALFSILSFRRAVCWMSQPSRRTTSPRQIPSASRSLKDLITKKTIPRRVI